MTIEVSKEFVDELSRRTGEINARRMFSYPQTPEERLRIEEEIQREYQRCKDDYNYWYKYYYVKLND